MKIMTDLYMMVRKETIQFEPKDRVRLDVTTKNPDGSVNGYNVGGIMFNQDSGLLVFNLYDDDGYLIVPKQGAYSIANLTTRQLGDVRNIVRNYVEKSMYRAKHVKWISDVLDNTKDNTIFFSGRNMPEGIIDLKKDGHIEITGFNAIFKSPEDGQILLTGANEEVGPFNYPLNELTDNGVSAVASCLGRVLSEKLDAEVRESLKEPDSIMQSWDEMCMDIRTKFGSSLDAFTSSDFSYPLGDNLFFEIQKGLPVVAKRDDKDLVIDAFGMDYIISGYGRSPLPEDHPLHHVPNCHPFEGIRRAATVLKDSDKIISSLYEVARKSDKVVKKATSRKHNNGLNL